MNDKMMLWDLSMELADKLIKFGEEKVKTGELSKENFDDVLILACLINCQILTLLKSMKISNQGKEKENEYKGLIHALEVNIFNATGSAIGLINYSNQGS